jgi:hypothetical protein
MDDTLATPTTPFTGYIFLETQLLPGMIVIPALPPAAAYPPTNSINWEPIEDLLFRGSWAEGFSQPVHSDSATSEILADTKVEQPTLPTTEVYNPASSQASNQPKQKPGEPSYEQCRSIRFWDAEAMYKEAKAKGDVGAMATAKAWMADTIMGQYQAVEAAVEAGEMSKVPAYGLADFLGKFMESYKELTGELPPGYYEAPNGFELDEGIIKPIEGMQPPELPTKEVFNPADAPKCEGEVM